MIMVNNQRTSSAARPDNKARGPWLFVVRFDAKNKLGRAPPRPLSLRYISAETVGSQRARHL